MKKLLFIGLLFVSLLSLTACGSDGARETYNGNANIEELSASQDLKKFDSVSELKDFLEQSQTASLNSYGGVNIKTLSARMDVAMVSSESAASAPGVAQDSDNSGGSGDGFSETNVQVEGVDEADIVKNDDRYIYLITDGRLVIIDSKNGIDSEILSETTLVEANDRYYYGNNVRELFLDGDKLLVFMDSYEPQLYFDQYNIRPVESYVQNTKAVLFDISNREDPEIVETYTISGYYYSSRLIDNTVYILTQENMYDWAHYEGPMIKYAEDKIVTPEIYYFDNPEQNYQMNTLTSIDFNTEEVVDSESFMLGYGTTVMVSEDNIYIAYQKQSMWCWGWRCASYDNDARERFTEVVVPLLEGDIKDNVEDILDQNLETEEEWKLISAEFAKFYEGLKNSEDMQERYEEMFADIEDALNEYDAKQAMENSKTVIHKIAIDNGNIEYKSKGEIDGRLLNQFSMDEFDGNLRVATTVSFWLSQGNVQYNNVYVLNENLEVIGSLENIAQNESIYSSRFMGDKLYLVTFRQIDPFFVIDLSNPRDPEVLGYLKIPGYSSYLHPIGDDKILGIGKDVGENEWGGTSAKGLKITLFDVSDFENPTEIDTKIIGIEGSDSPVLYDHKAFTYIEDKNLVVIPVTEVEERIKSSQYSYRNKIWNGAYVIELTDDGLDALGRIEHSSSLTDYYYWFNDASVLRSLYIGDNLFTISTKYVKINDLNDITAEGGSIELPFTKPEYYGYGREPMPVDEKPIPVDIGGGIGSTEPSSAE
ncbi:MAG TPA: beta-propeller domain-containing protein [Alphaproteobacteria bacterium]|nr:beta-propeller domain-containing protein [Alphaproteobacteria bacterium]